jgi:hypothetical protein
MNNDISSVIAKVQKLQSLAANNSNLHEAQAAAKLADQLMQEYRISVATLEAASGNKESMTVESVYSGGKRSAWREILLSGICSHYGCSFYIYGARHMEYRAVGVQSDLEIVKYMFAWLEQTLKSMSANLNKGLGVAYGKSWLVGAAEGVRETFRQLNAKAHEEAKNSSNDLGGALVLLNNRVAESKSYLNDVVLKGRSNPAKSLYGGSNCNARWSGMAYGKSIDVNQKALR